MCLLARLMMGIADRRYRRFGVSDPGPLGHYEGKIYMSNALSFAEINGQHVELLPARTVLSTFSMGEAGGAGGAGAGSAAGGAATASDPMVYGDLYVIGGNGGTGGAGSSGAGGAGGSAQ